MPLGFGNLKSLVILPKFVVGPKKDSQLKELKNLQYLQGELVISELQKVEEITDANDANLFGKQGLSNLILLWNEDFRNLHNGKHESQVLQCLRPSTNLKNFTISHYGGVMFPPWLNSPSYSKLVSLCLRGCPNVEHLPSLGQLPSLRELSLKGLHTVRMVGSEFYGGKRPFSSLKTLEFEEMLAWKDLYSYARGREREVPFSCLQHLVVMRCPSLVGTLPYRLDCLVRLEIHSCPHLDNSTNIISLPSLRELCLENCSKKILRSLVKQTSLTILKIRKLIELVCFDRGFTSYLVKLKKLYIEECDKLTYLWQDGNETLSLTCLQLLAVKSCPHLRFFVAREGEIELPSKLESMNLRDCESLEKLPSKIYGVKYLSIWSCPKFTGLTISPYDLSDTTPMYQLESLTIRDCDSLTSFPFAKGRLAALKTLTIQEWEGVESLEEIPVESLEYLCIDKCGNLGSLSQCLGTLSYLTHLEISECPELEIQDFPPLPITLSSFYLYDCAKISCLPNQWHHLVSLQALIIRDCQSIECFPKGGFPPNLQILVIRGCKNVKQPVEEWGLPFLTSLERLKIDGISMGRGGDEEKMCFPSDDDEDAWSLVFPSSLTFLCIDKMRKVERLSSGLRSHLSSLTSLSIRDCPKLRDLPEDGLPPSLRELWIFGCSIQKDRCSKFIGHYWPLIQHIPSIWIDRHPIH